MLIVGSIISFGLLMYPLARSLWWTWSFTAIYRRQRTAETRASASSSAPASETDSKVAVILPLRGADPFLGDCLRALLAQDHTNHEVHIVVDSIEDTAWQLADSIIAEIEATHATLHCTANILSTCTPRQSGMLHVFERLEESVETLVIIDADVVPHRSWLKDLVTPLTDPQLGAVCGVRWFMPQSTEWGTLVRYLWNAGAIPEMYNCRIMWGGSLAIKSSVLRQSEFVDRWSRILFEDTHTVAMVSSVGLKTDFVPEVTMVNREAISLRRCIPYMQRQMLNARLYHPRWLLILADCILSTAAVVFAVVMLVTAVLTQNVAAAAWAAGGLAMYSAGMTGYLLWIEYHVRRTLRARGEPTTPVSLRNLLAGGLTQFVFFGCTISAAVQRRVEWRGIEYEFDGPFDVRLLNYHPFKPRSESVNANASL